jgi:DNA replication protein DnaC
MDHHHHPTPPLCGRAQESQLLYQAYRRSKQQCGVDDDLLNSRPIKNKQELVLIQGLSGTGKTTLAQQSIKKTVMEEDGGFFLSGKFELYSFQNPYEVFVSAFTTFAELVQNESTSNGDDENKARRHDAMRQAITEAVGTEGTLLTNMIYRLFMILLDEAGMKTTTKPMARTLFIVWRLFFLDSSMPFHLLLRWFYSLMTCNGVTQPVCAFCKRC